MTTEKVLRQAEMNDPIARFALADLLEEEGRDEEAGRIRQGQKYRTIKAALADGYEEMDTNMYGDDQITIKGHRLIRKPKRAISRTAWERSGYRVRRGEQPHGSNRHRVGGAKTVCYETYRRDQVEKKPETR